MSLKDQAVRNLTQPPRVADWTDLPARAWDDIQKTIVLTWDAWTGLFPRLEFWDPLGATVTLSLLVGLVAWLIKVRPG